MERRHTCHCDRTRSIDTGYMQRHSPEMETASPWLSCLLLSSATVSGKVHISIHTDNMTLATLVDALRLIQALINAEQTSVVVERSDPEQKLSNMQNVSVRNAHRGSLFFRGRGRHDRRVLKRVDMCVL